MKNQFEREASSLPINFTAKIRFRESCWIWVAVENSGGYGGYRLKGKRVGAHRFSWEHFNGEIPEGICVLHKCDTPACVNPSHLFLGTKKDNMLDMIAKGRQKHPRGDMNGSKTHPGSVPRGDRHGMAKLTQVEVDEIRKIYKRGIRGEYSQRGLANKYKVAQSQISDIVNHKQWKVDNNI